jgi:hypothetical protein
LLPKKPTGRMRPAVAVAAFLFRFNPPLTISVTADSVGWGEHGSQ